MRPVKRADRRADLSGMTVLSPASGTSAVLRAVHPVRPDPVTYRITPMTRRPGEPAGFLVEQADGDLAVEDWDDVERSRVLMTAFQVRELVRRVTATGR